MNSNYLYLMHESFPPLHLDFSPSFLHSKKLKVPLGKHPQRLFGFQEKENSREKRKTRELCISLSVKCNILSRNDFHPSYSLYKSKACDWLVTRIRKEITSKNTKENI